MLSHNIVARTGGMNKYRMWRELAVCGKIQMTFSITQKEHGKRTRTRTRTENSRIFSSPSPSPSPSPGRRVCLAGKAKLTGQGKDHDEDEDMTAGTLGTDRAQHNRKSKWQFNLTEPTKTKSNANRSASYPPLASPRTWKCSFIVVYPAYPI